ncbi:hypothetical protein C7974DRAFT_390362 [Boeremia exigua]|uniref:uncharacterized protein n=1 Tax=Boeremia exigua TaxID=749465 RepID=UPI001E8E5B03|nr:uncharacterized protein C7974DRAFT_390362 [Boeremia exigua]KAH6637846.1 hypothetical protein C7974DRAFT_390362 [Boeremia exigua]
MLAFQGCSPPSHYLLSPVHSTSKTLAQALNLKIVNFCTVQPHLPSLAAMATSTPRQTTKQEERRQAQVTGLYNPALGTHELGYVGPHRTSAQNTKLSLQDSRATSTEPADAASSKYPQPATVSNATLDPASEGHQQCGVVARSDHLFARILWSHWTQRFLGVLTILIWQWAVHGWRPWFWVRTREEQERWCRSSWFEKLIS